VGIVRLLFILRDVRFGAGGLDSLKASTEGEYTRLPHNEVSSDVGEIMIGPRS